LPPVGVHCRCEKCPEVVCLINIYSLDWHESETRGGKTVQRRDIVHAPVVVVTCNVKVLSGDWLSTEVERR
jgi:hypothetical protein